MEIVILKAEEDTLRQLASVFQEAAPDSNVYAFQNPLDVFAFSEDHRVNVLVSEAYMDGMNGWTLAGKVRQRYNDLKTIFLVPSSEENVKKFSVTAKGFLSVPADAEMVRGALKKIYQK